jgi:hypothetical protein
MIPDFDERGYLPAGVHSADITEVLARFGTASELRRDQAQSVEWLIPLCKAAGIIRLVVNGSFVTNVTEPNDVDCILLIGPAYNELSESAAERDRGLPFLSLQIVRQLRFDDLMRFFATDRDRFGKGLVEIIL